MNTLRLHRISQRHRVDLDFDPHFLLFFRWARTRRVAVRHGRTRGVSPLPSSIRFRFLLQVWIPLIHHRLRILLFLLILRILPEGQIPWPTPLQVPHVNIEIDRGHGDCWQRKTSSWLLTRNVHIGGGGFDGVRVRFRVGRWMRVTWHIFREDRTQVLNESGGGTELGESRRRDQARWRQCKRDGLYRKNIIQRFEL